MSEIVSPTRFYITVRRVIETTVGITADQARARVEAIALLQSGGIEVPSRSEWTDVPGSETYSVRRRRGGRRGGQSAAEQSARRAYRESRVEKTWTFFGHWEDDRIVVEFSVEGEVEDDREDDGEHDEGLWSASGSGVDIDTVRAAVVAEYENDV